MPIDITANYIRIKVASSKGFTRFRVKSLGKGIKAVIGFKAGGGSQIQSVLFPKGNYTLASAKAWVKSHGYHVAESFYVYDIHVGVNFLDFEEEKINSEIEEIVQETLPDKVPVKKGKWEWLLDE